MENGIYTFIKNDNVFVVVCSPNCPSEWHALRELDGCAVDSGELFYIMGTDARGELEETSSDKLLVFKSDNTIYFKCPLKDDVLKLLSSDNGSSGFCLIMSEELINEEEAYRMFLDQEIDGVICAFYTELKKRQVFKVDSNGNIIGLQESNK